jgi:hypothetical protein
VDSPRGARSAAAVRGTDSGSVMDSAKRRLQASRRARTISEQPLWQQRRSTPDQSPTYL